MLTSSPSPAISILSSPTVYKYWDSITKEDIEFSVGSKAAVWEVKEGLLSRDEDELSGETGGYSGEAAYPPQHSKSYGY